VRKVREKERNLRGRGEAVRRGKKTKKENV